MRPLKHAIQLQRIRFQCLLVIFFLLAAWLRFAPAPYALPYVVNPDEPNFYRLAQDQRGVLDGGWRKEWLAGYPPGYITFYAAVVEGMNRLHTFDIHQDMGKVVGLMRLVNALIDLVTMACVVRLACLLGGRWAGVIAAGIYSVSTPFVQNAALSLPDPLLTLFVVITVLCGLKAWQRHSVRWALWSTVFGLIAVIIKYPAAPVLLLPGLFFLRELITKRVRAIPTAALALVLVAATAYGLLAVYGGANLNNMESNQVRSHFVENTLSLTRWFNVLKAIGGTLGIGLSLGLVVIGLRLVLAHKRKRREFYEPIVTVEALLILVTGLAVLALVPAYLANIPAALYPVRYTLPAAAIFVAAVAALVARLLVRWPGRMQLLIGLVCMGVLLPDLINYALVMRLPNPFTLAQKWFEENVPDNSVLWMESGDPYISLSHYDRGYRGFKTYSALFAQDVPKPTVEQRQSVDYLYLTSDDEARWPLTPGWENLNRYTRIKTFHGVADVIPSVAVYLPYALPHPQKTQWTLANTRLQLRGFDIRTQAGVVSVMSYWQASPTAPTQDYSYSLYATPIDQPTQVLAQHDSGLGYRPTSTWTDPNEILQAEMAPLDTTGLTAGDYDLWVVVYNSQTGERFALNSGATAWNLGRIAVSAS